MHFPSVCAILALALASVVAADFRVFIGTYAAYTGDTFDIAYLFLNPPNCNDAQSHPYILNGNDNDASKGGYACDGCDGTQPRSSWHITRFEMYDGSDNPVTTEAVGHITFYESSTTPGQYDIITQDNNGNQQNRGTCNLPSAPQELDCNWAIDNVAATEFFDCSTTLTLVSP